MTAVSRFYELSKEAADIMNDSLDLKVAQPKFCEILVLIKNNLNCKLEFIDTMIIVLKNPDAGPPELLSYLNHDLKWPEMKERLQTLLDNPKFERNRSFLRSQIEAFEDHWGDAFLYED